MSERTSIPERRLKVPVHGGLQLALCVLSGYTCLMTPTPLLPPEIWNALPVEAQTLIEAMRLQIETMQRQIDALQTKVQSLQTNSRNSSKPPATDPPHLKRQPPRLPSGKKRLCSESRAEGPLNPDFEG